MKRAEVLQHKIPAGVFEEISRTHYRFSYYPTYRADPISLTMPVQNEPYEFQSFPPLFDGLLPEGAQLEALLRRNKIDRHDYFSQLLAVGQDVVGSLQIQNLQ